jgi:hypothetical protein
MPIPAVQHVPIGSIKPNPSNPRTIRDERFHKLVQSIKDFPEMLELRPIVTDADRVVLGGNMRLKACKAAGLKTVPVVVADHLTESQRREFIVKDNVGFGDWDWDALANEWDAGELAEWGLDVPDSAQEPAVGLTDPDAVPDVPEEPITKAGDIWLLGPHRLMCGNSQNVQIKQALFGTQTFGVMITDPPFGINYQSNMDGSLPRSIAGDKDTVARDSALLSVDEAFPVACFATWHCAPPRKPRGMLIWKKNVGGMGDLSFPWSLDYEVIWIFGKGWKGHRGSSVLEGETIVTWNTGPAKRLHPHQKPVQVLTQIIEKSQGVVFDPFLGSGSTLLACQQLGRTCYGIELDPRYCDVIVRRWEEFTGQKAIRQTSTNREDTGNADAAAAVA